MQSFLCVLLNDPWTPFVLFPTCVRKVCAGAVVLIFGLAVTALGDLFVDLPSLVMLGFGFLPGLIFCCWASS